MNGEGILDREVAGDITLLEKVEPPKNCLLGAITRPATIRALRLGEHACKKVKRVENLLYIVILILATKPADLTVWDLLKAILKASL